MTIKSNVALYQDAARKFNNREGLFGKEVTDYSRLTKAAKAFEPYQTLWETVAQWIENYDTWVNGSFNSLDAEKMERDHTIAQKNMYKSVKVCARARERNVPCVRARCCV